LSEVSKPLNSSSNSQASKLSVKHSSKHTLHPDAPTPRMWRYGPKKVAWREAEVEVEATVEDQKLGAKI
jgi:predicted DNA-binding transcriptional regulator AlpA